MSGSPFVSRLENSKGLAFYFLTARLHCFHSVVQCRSLEKHTQREIKKMSIKDLAWAHSIYATLVENSGMAEAGSELADTYALRARLTTEACNYAPTSRNYNWAYLYAIESMSPEILVVDEGLVSMSLDGDYTTTQTITHYSPTNKLAEIQAMLDDTVNGLPGTAGYGVIFYCWLEYLAKKAREGEQNFEAYQLASRAANSYAAMISHGSSDSIELVDRACFVAYEYLASKHGNSEALKTAFEETQEGKFGALSLTR